MNPNVSRRWKDEGSRNSKSEMGHAESRQQHRRAAEVLASQEFCENKLEHRDQMVETARRKNHESYPSP